VSSGATVPNISHYNVSDVALYYQALVALASAPITSTIATEEVRRRAVTYLERRRAMFSLPPPRGQLETLGEKLLADLKQMDLASVEENKVKLTAAGVAIVENLKKGEGRRARLAILGRLVETYENAAYLCATLVPPKGQRLYLPIPRATTEEVDDDDGETRLVPSNLVSVCAAWAEWCRDQKRPDLMPADLQTRTEELLEASTDKRGFAEKARNALAQLVLDAATRGRIGKAAIFRTIRDRLSTAGGLNSITRPVPGKPLSVEVVFSCMHFGAPLVRPEEWQPLGANLTLLDNVWIHEAEPGVLEPSVLTALKETRRHLVERAGYYRIYELRDRVCEDLGLSQGMFDSVFVHIYRTQSGLMTLGVDYEKITAKRLPIEIRDGASSNLFNLVAFRGE
jgi:hypothetical protein